MAEYNAVVGIYTTHPEAEAAVKALQRSGFDMQQLSIVGKDYHTEEHLNRRAPHKDALGRAQAQKACLGPSALHVP